MGHSGVGVGVGAYEDSLQEEGFGKGAGEDSEGTVGMMERASGFRGLREPLNRKA